MSKIAQSSIFASLFVLALSCAPAPESGTDGGTPDAGGGSSTPDAGAPVVDAGGGGGGGGGGSLDLGAACAYGTNACGEGKVCTSIFLQQGTNAPNTETAACYAACDSAGAECSAAFGQTGICQQTADGNVCVAASPNLAPCGNGANASCSDTPVCAFGAGNNFIGVCVTVCTPGNESTCSALPDQMMENDGCGCAAGQECSVSNLGFEGGDGVCASPSEIGDTCGVDATTGGLMVCTGGQTCAGEQGASTGTCEAGDVGDAGPAPDTDGGM